MRPVFTPPAGYEIDTSKTRLDIDLIHRALAETYWAEGIPRDIVERSIRNFDCFGVYKNAEQVGFARVVTDRATFGYLADVIVVPAERGRGLGKWLLATIMDEPHYANFRRWLLATRDAHELYRQFGFTDVPPNIFMEIRDAEVYRRSSAAVM